MEDWGKGKGRREKGKGRRKVRRGEGRKVLKRRVRGKVRGSVERKKELTLLPA